jgi:hypothetical protein
VKAKGDSVERMVTQSVGVPHVGDPRAIEAAGRWVCVDNCPHPDHADASNGSNQGGES